MTYYVPMVIEQSNFGERAYDIYSRLLKDRIIFIGSEKTCLSFVTSPIVQSVYAYFSANGTLTYTVLVDTVA